MLGRVLYIQQAQGEYWRSLSDSLHQKFIELDAERGTIYSEDGQMLSTSIPFFDIYMDFGAEGLRDKGGKRFKENIDSFSLVLANFFEDKSAKEYKKELQLAYNEKDRYYNLKKGLTFDQYKSFREFPLVRQGRNKSGVIVEVKTKRLNPFGMLARRTIGLARENAQNVGLERTYDSLLKGTTGKRLVRFVGGSAYVPVDGYEIDPENGKDIMTTLDINMQDIANNALMKMMVQSEAEYGTCIVMETATGKIKAIANLGRGKNGNYDEALNYALRTTEPGSTIKLATLMAVLDEGSSKVNDLVEVGSAGQQYVGVRMVTDAERSPRPVMTVRECFAHSSNVAMGKLAYKAFAQEPDKFKSYLHKFHLDKMTGLGLVGEEPPVLPKLKRNREGLHAMITASFGYALEVSPLHTAMLYNAVANGGKMVQPYLVNSIKSNGVTVEEFEPTVLEEAIAKPATIKAARQAMESVVTEGTAKGVFADCPFPVAGKTGTAHVAAGDIKYDDGVYQASFAGYFPADKPEYTIVVLIRTHPHAAMHYGGQLAAPVFKEVATKLFAMYVKQKRTNAISLVVDSTAHMYAGYKKDIQEVLQTIGVKNNDGSASATWAKLTTVNNQVLVRANTVAKKVIPDVQGMNVKDAVYLLENMDVKVSVSGRGKVVMQSLAAGTPIRRNERITLLLN
ncbi:penicillin-binding protein [Flavisolibacter tropicus]|uniref:penicillin-binding protein n=1 Tax=Flavisolibacter tropicus TaxID=1492898 RepID=UPI001D03677B|nr:penicillin-binding protein [Flavisolibacter tropicus]